MDLKLDHVVEILSHVQPRQRCVFAALCAERLAPWFDLVANEMALPDRTSVHEGLHLIWEYAERGSYEDIAVASALQRCESQAESNWKHQWANAADDCVASVAYGLMAVRSNRAADAAWAGMRITDAIYQYVLTNIVFKGKSGALTVTKMDRRNAVDHPLHEAEISRQENDLADLKKIEMSSLGSSLQSLRDRARASVVDVFGVAPR